MAELHSQQENKIQSLITQHIDLWTGAVKAKSSAGRGSRGKRELYGIKKLRELILELAVRGKLVAQDPNDEPVSVLLERILLEKIQLVKDGKIKKEKASTALDEKDLPFEVPENWCWEKLPNITFFQEGPGILAKDFRDSGIPLVRIAGMHGNKLSLDGCNYLDEKMVGKKWSHYRIEKGDIVISSSASLGKVAKVDEETAGSIVYTGLIRFRPYSNVSENYISKFFASPEFSRQISNNSRGAAIKHFGPTHLKTMFVPLPPVKEQHRIVAKVDELMALCDQLEQQTESSFDAHQTLVQILLDTLLQSADAEELEQNWQRLSAHFDLLFTTEQSIDQLKQTILQLAVMGKLVPQDPNDEPASELLKRIAAEKEELIKQKKIKKQKPLPPISEDEKPFQLPKGWECTRFGYLVDLKSGITFKATDELVNGAYCYCKVSDMNSSGNETTIFSTAMSVNPTSTQIGASIASGSIIFPKRGGAIATNKKRYVCSELFIDPNIMAVKPIGRTSLKYIMVWLSSFDMAKLNSGTSVPQINNKDIEPLIFALPPVCEQNRIVAKVDQLMAFCDQLKAKLADSKTTQLNLTDALVAQAV